MSGNDIASLVSVEESLFRQQSIGTEMMKEGEL